MWKSENKRQRAKRSAKERDEAKRSVKERDEVKRSAKEREEAKRSENEQEMQKKKKNNEKERKKGKKRTRELSFHVGKLHFDEMKTLVFCKRHFTGNLKRGQGSDRLQWTCKFSTVSALSIIFHSECCQCTQLLLIFTLSIQKQFPFGAIK